jgi:predicted glycoside hydrolase/deacetylase ChbG (UPF0249 family)
MADAPRRIWLCADDYGISPAVSAGIRQLIARRRINATSVMVASPYFNLAEAEALDALNAGEPRAALGLHVTLTAPFAPVSEGFTPLRKGRFLPMPEMMSRGMARRLKVERLVIEIGTQLRLFLEAFGRLPDFLDGHQHVHLAPQVRDALLKVATEAAPRAWVRQCGRPPGARRLRDAKALVLDILSLAFRRQALELGVATNPAFAGSYEFTAKADFAKLFPGFLTGLPDGGLVMCHPGFVDDELRSLDPLTDLRERELAYFESEAFTQALAAQGATLAEPAVA